MRDAVICEPLRTAVGGFGGALRDVPVQELGATVVRALIERSGIPPESVDDLVLGHGYPSMDAPALGRVVALGPCRAEQPLLFYRGRYRVPDAASADAPPEVVDTLLAWPRHADWI